ncbi:MAG: bifunctional DNA-formamidopyrimidine glycosylase/DNA-(apurinic or apyrimidinic site) lyase [Alphaproteobacteria bacterium]|nr:bifunctional DNA-formamidopyrimidine glycosylase/DNA-(apurinic or apyrimidinic site) lyase [Alphaproteobacteria bacterium]
MPELPEVETICQALKPVLEGASFQKIQLNRPNLRYPFPVNLESELAYYPISHVRRRAKYILVDFSHGLTLIWHLGMSGRVVVENITATSLKPSPHDHVIFTTSHNYKITYRDPRRFGFLRLSPTNQLGKISPFSTLGPEALNDPKFNAKVFYDRLQSCNISLKNALLNQKIIAGIGNIYASEALWQARLSPLRLTKSLTLTETERLLKELQDVLRRAIAAGGSTLRDHARPNGDIGYFQHEFKVYNRESALCFRCQVFPLSKIIQSGRATYYCIKCQQ